MPKETTDILIRKMILRTLKETKENIRATATRLSCSPNTVWRGGLPQRRKKVKMHHAPGCDMEHLSFPKVLSGCKGDLDKETFLRQVMPILKS